MMLCATISSALCRSQRALNRVTEAQVDILRGLIRVDSDEVLGVFRLGRLEELAIVLHLRLDAGHVARHQLAADALVGGLSLGWCEELAGGLVQLHARELLQDGFVRDLQRNHLLRLNLQVPQQLDLLHVERAPVQDPPIQPAVWLAEALVDEVDDDVIGDDPVLRDVALQLSRVVIVIVSSGDLHDQLLNLDINDLVLLGDAQGVFFLLRAWRAHKYDSLRSSWGISVLQLEDAIDFLNDSHLRLIRFKFGYEALADVFNAPNLQIVLEHGVVCDPSALLRIVNAAQARLCLARAKVAHDCLESILIRLVEQDELIWDDTHFLEGYRLSLRPREALNDPTLLALLHLLNLLLDQFDHDFIPDVTVRFQ